MRGAVFAIYHGTGIYIRLHLERLWNDTSRKAGGIQSCISTDLVTEGLRRSRCFGDLAPLERSSADVDHLSLGAHYGRPWIMSMKEPKEGTDGRCLPSS